MAGDYTSEISAGWHAAWAPLTGEPGLDSTGLGFHMIDARTPVFVKQAADWGKGNGL